METLGSEVLLDVLHNELPDLSELLTSEIFVVAVQEFVHAADQGGEVGESAHDVPGDAINAGAKLVQVSQRRDVGEALDEVGERVEVFAPLAVPGEVSELGKGDLLVHGNDVAAEVNGVIEENIVVLAVLQEISPVGHEVVEGGNGVEGSVEAIAEVLLGAVLQALEEADEHALLGRIVEVEDGGGVKTGGVSVVLGDDAVVGGHELRLASGGVEEVDKADTVLLVQAALGVLQDLVGSFRNAVVGLAGVSGHALRGWHLLRSQP